MSNKEIGLKGKLSETQTIETALKERATQVNSL